MARFYFQKVVSHPGLRKQRVVRGDDRRLVEAAAQAQMQTWNEQYSKKLLTDERRHARESKKQELEESLQEAKERTHEAEAELDALRRLLVSALQVDHRIDWSDLKQHQPFSQPPPQPRAYVPLPVEPTPKDQRFRPQFGLLDKLWQGSAQKKQQAAEALFASEHAEWIRRMAAVQASNEVLYSQNLRTFEDWQQRHEAFEQARAHHNAKIDERCHAYQSLKPDAVTEFCEMVLSKSKYPDCCPQSFDTEYRPAEKTLFVDYELPEPEQVPRLAEVKFVRSKCDFQEVELTRKQADAFYEDLLCQIVLRTVHELYEADVVRALEVVVVNGTVTALDEGTGHRSTRCVLSLRAKRGDFLAINLRQVSAPACFRSLGGIAGARLSDLKAIKPTGVINRNDARFSGAHDITGEAPSVLDEWHGLIQSLADPTDIHFLAVGSLATLVGFPAAEKYSAPLSRQLAGAIAGRGFGIEPDARHGGPPYRASEEVALFRSLGNEVTAGYTGAAALLQLGISIAAADDDISQAELEVTRDFIYRSVTLTAHERQRLNALEKLLCRHPQAAARSLGRLSKRLPQESRHRIGELLVCVAGADGVISSSEWRALDRACHALDLPASALEEILRELGAELQEVTVQEAEPGEKGEPIPSRAPEPAVAPAFTLDMSRVAKIAQETTELVSILASVMNEDEPPALRPDRVVISPGPGTASIEELRQLLDAKHRPLLDTMLCHDSLTKDEFTRACRELNLIPLGAFDAINEWADDHLGDFLLEGEDPITVHRRLIPVHT